MSRSLTDFRDSVSGFEARGPSSNYDSRGEYVYVKLSGENIDPDQVWPVLYVGDEAVTEYVNINSIKDEFGDWTYKLKKLKTDAYWSAAYWKDADELAYAYRIEKAKPDYEYIDRTKD